MDLYKAKYSDKKFDRYSKSKQTSRNSRDDEHLRSYRNSRDERKPEMHTVTCGDCGDECQIPFEPKFNRPVYCSDCFQKHKPQESGDRYSRDERPSRDRYSRDERPSRDRYSRDERPSRDRYSRDERPSRDRYSRDERPSRDRYSRDERPSRDRYSRDERPSRDRYSRDERPSRDRYSRDERPSRDRYSRDERPSRDRYSRDERKPEMHTVTCGDCGDECQIPFEPKFNRPVYCSDCFQKHKPQESGDRYSRDERPSRSSQDDFRTSKSKSEKFLKKTESFYSNGSEKFYSSLKEKLFEILGGKTCSSCGFKDERALGFNHINDEDAFDSIRRGGFASSWGKYISEPELAKKDLRVLCLNCNEIRQPQAKTEPKKPKTLNKKSRYFPR